MGMHKSESLTIGVELTDLTLWCAIVVPTRFRYTTALRDAFSGGGISSLQDLDDRGWVSGSQANVFVANHDTERVGCHHFP